MDTVMTPFNQHFFCSLNVEITKCNQQKQKHGPKIKAKVI